MKYLFIAEKPSAMKTIQSVYKANKKRFGDIDFFALSGHICKLCEPKEYEKWNIKWYERKLPMIPDPFMIGVLDQKKVNDLKHQLKENKYDAIIVGTDSDVEGNGIYDLIETYLGLQNYKTYRFFESDLTPEGILKSLAHMEDYHTNPRDIGMTQAFRIRSRFDWLIGFNLTVAYTLKSGFLMKVGRVKAPTLKLVYDNCKKIEAFQNSSAYQPMIRTENPELTAGYIDDDEKPVSYPDQMDALKILDTLGSTAKVISFKIKETYKKPEQLYKLSDIQYEAGKIYGYSPEETLNTIQILYETYKVVSYPRTDGRYVSSEKAKDFRKMLEPVKSMPELRELALKVTTVDIERVQQDTFYVNDDEVQKTSHDALVPTGVKPPDRMKKIERDICSMIFRRFLAMFLPPMKEEKTKCVIESNGKRFLCSGSKVLDPGYMQLYQTPKNTSLPHLAVGTYLPIKEKLAREIVSRPPTRFTQATLLKAMENIQKYVEKGELKNALKKAKGIGQPSSRASIITDLIKSGYIVERPVNKVKHLFITDMGKQYIENLGNCSVSSPELSAEWEVHMSDIREGTVSFEEIYPKILDYVNTALNELENLKFKNISDFDSVCPLCGSPIRKLPKGWRCSSYPDCQFSIWKTIAGKELTDQNIQDLIQKKETEVIHGFRSRDGRSFDARLILKDGKITWGGPEEIGLNCPKCGKPLVKRKLSISCSGCDFSLWRSIAGKNLTDRNIRDLIQKGETGIMHGFKSRSGNTFDAKLILNDGKVVFKFDYQKGS